MSVHTSLSFLKIGSLVVSDIVDGDSWPYYLATDEGRILKKKKKKKKKNGGPILAETRFICHFLKFGSLVFFEIA